mmetsp:Transcript_9783/g.24908  ORF Transcript_9783/g.24908 Transcript_9783/m.24908 type:complete len:215 (+) Transcript_9783:125-769(+)
MIAASLFPAGTCAVLAFARVGATRRAISRPAAPQLAARPRQRRPQPHSRTSGGRLLPCAAAKDSLPEAEDARGAIALGLKLYADGDYEEAYALFTKVVKEQVPGTGTKRFRDKPPAPSEGEKMAALYNIACCQSKMGDMDTALAAFAGALEKGFEDIATARSDPDLAQLREDERFEGLLARLAPAATGSGPFGWLAYQLNFKNSAIAKVMKDPK